MTTRSPNVPPAVPAPPAARPRALLGTGRVRHLRLRPARHGFEYPTWFLLLPLRTLAAAPEPALARNRFGWASFHDADHGDGGPDCLAWFDAFVRANGVQDVDGEVWLHTTPRILGYAFKPVNFWYGHRADGTLAVIVAEVNNTFGGRHCYLLRGEDPARGPAFGQELRSGKAFHVSPFNRIEGGYRFRFMRTDLGMADGAGRCVARIDYDDADGPLLLTSVSGDLAPLTAAHLRGALLRMPWLAFGVIARIHWQALRLLVKRVPFFGRDGTPAAAELLSPTATGAHR